MADVTLRLLIDAKEKRVLFAEAGKNFVDFLLNIMALPIGTITSLLTKESMVGCLGNLYESIEVLNDSYILPMQNKDTILKPLVTVCGSDVPRLLPGIKSFSSMVVYCCGSSNYNNCRTVAMKPGALCKRCNMQMNVEAEIVEPPPPANQSAAAEEGGYVKGVVTYMVMDDLSVKPMSTISSITLLNKFNVKEVGSLEEKVVNLTMDEGVKLLKASLQSKTVLTDVFVNQPTATIKI